ncbi:MAG: Type 1 glutamine amidotransferase-like domain-containing protein [bacterium]|nr:Type 1 glutamine amidotransferase-like domain-containing protein [bacterium]
MKLLLTSAGITNESIKKALAGLIKKPFEETNLAYIPTAANIEKGDKDWLISDLVNCQKCNFKQVDIVDFSAIPREMWLSRLEYADVLLFGGGNTDHLLKTVKSSGLEEALPGLLKTRVYVGISAGSMITAFKESLSSAALLYHEETGEIKDNKALGYVNFQTRPHLNSEYFPKVTLPYLAEIAKELSDTFYAIDDQTAIQVIDSEITIISEGEWKKFN